MKISKLNNKDKAIATEIRRIFQASYKVEAEILNAVDFPPLKRTLENFLKSNTYFYGCFIADEITGITEIWKDESKTHIQSLVVSPQHFKKGVASTLLKHVIDNCKTKKITVETGLKNTPAVNLYKKIGFTVDKDWDTNHGVRKVGLYLNR